MKLSQWEKYFPDVGTNRQEPTRFYLEVERGLSIRAREGFYKNLQEALATGGTDGSFAHRLAAALSMHVRFGSEPLKWEEGEVTTLEQYVETLLQLGSRRYLYELLGLVRKANSFGGDEADFFERLSGGAPGTTEGLTPRAV